MSFEFEKIEIDGVIRIIPHLFEDVRGVYNKIYEKEIFKKNGIVSDFTESSDLYSTKGALRGLHYQTKSPQAKLVHCISGKIYDVVVDLRTSSKTFGEWHGEILSADDNIALYIPEGFAHGFIALEDNTIFSYQCSGEYLPEYCGGIRWDDTELKITWPLKEYGIDNIIATEKDSTWPSFLEYKANNKDELLFI